MLNRNLRLLFIAGAPRSGTTMLGDLIDGHPQILRFPLEHSVFQSFYLKNKRDKDYWLNDFITNSSEGQQSVLASEENLNSYSNKILKEFNQEFSLNIDPNKYLATYQAVLSKLEINIYNIFYAMAQGLIAASQYAQSKLDNVIYFAIKAPYFTEVCGSDTYKVDNCKVIHISREPIARYASAKKRRLVLHKMNNKRLARLNFYSFTKGITQIDLSSRELSLKNLAHFGKEKHYNIDFEKLIQNSEKEMRSLQDWLGLEFSTCFEKPTKLGASTQAGSHFNKKKKINKVHKDSSNRKSAYLSVTNIPERKVHSFYLSETFKFKDRLKLLYLLLPFKQASISHYFYQFFELKDIFKSSDKIRFELKEELPENFKSKPFGSLELNGAT